MISSYDIWKLGYSVLTMSMLQTDFNASYQIFSCNCCKCFFEHGLSLLTSAFKVSCWFHLRKKLHEIVLASEERNTPISSETGLRKIDHPSIEKEIKNSVKKRPI